MAGKGQPPRRNQSLTWRVSLLPFAQAAVQELISCNSFFNGTKNEFALRMGWVKPNGAIDEPDRRRVEDVCNLTRDQDDLPSFVAEALGGFVITYAPNQGGMLLIDPSGDMPFQHLAHMLFGDLQKQQNIKTINRRRQPDWKKAGNAAMNSGDGEMAQLFWVAADQIDRTGFVSDSTLANIFKTAHVRGLLQS